ncbi:signal transduction protein [Hahella sp. CCB-MM4]|uniref:HDOD domain-containing protein n=1 Tax=Hahella sp. (strain CCB-MM4) TaxID=1926491 RepID=UPI000B9BA667|nr:HDOD domain-containing protein [Hahella sp. CCB-MM4]OZG71144.1 signal transduction protein [Hahella sp. CCB-MM4]
MSWDIKEVKTRLSELSSPNPEIEAVIQMMEDGVSDLKLIAQKVKLDPILSARLLHLANSSFYGFPREVKDVEMACVILGANTIRNLVYTLVVLARFNNPKQDSRLDYDKIWLHGLMTASIAQVIYKHLKLDFQVGFTSGLFYNLGMVLMDYLYTDQLQHCMKVAEAEQRNLLEVERAAMGKDHQELTGIVLDIWSFPKAIVDNISSPMAEAGLEGMIVTLADVLTSGTMGPLVSGVRLNRVEECELEPCGVDLAELPNLIMAAQRLYMELAGEFFSSNK